MFNNRKRPRQFLPSASQTMQSGTRIRPTGAAAYPDLMPVGGFSGRPNSYQYENFPTSGRGAANINRTTNYQGNSNRSTGRGYQADVNQRNCVQSPSGPYQPNVGGYTFQNRNLPSTSRGRSCTQPYDTVLDSGPYKQSGSYIPNSNSTNVYGYNQNTWNGRQQSYDNNRVTASSSRAAYNSLVPNTRSLNHQQQPQQWNQSNSIHQGTDRGGALLNRRSSYQVNMFANNPVNQAEDIADEWNNSFTGPNPVIQGPNTTNNIKETAKASSSNKAAISEIKKSLHFLTVDIAGVKRWSKFKDSVHIMFEVFGQLDSAVVRGNGDCKEFLIRDEKRDALRCVFYEIDRHLPKITRGQWYRMVGTYDECKDQFKCFSIRPIQPTEGKLVFLLTQKSAEIMLKLTRNMREQ